jgi:hypothetical protein
MFRETLRQDDSVVGLACEGKLGQDELKRMHALLHERLAAPAKPGLVVDLEKFDGYESLSAMLGDLKMDASHRNDFSRIAVIGSRKWMEWGTMLARFLTTAEMRWFEVREADQAVDWVRTER